MKATFVNISDSFLTPTQQRVRDDFWVSADVSSFTNKDTSGKALLSSFSIMYLIK